MPSPGEAPNDKECERESGVVPYGDERNKAKEAMREADGINTSA